MDFIRKKVIELFLEFIEHELSLSENDIELEDELIKDWELTPEEVNEFYEKLNDEFGTDLSFPETDDKIQKIIEVIWDDI